MALFQKSHAAGECSLSIGSFLRGAARRLGQDRRGSIVIIMALVTPALVMSVGLAIEVSHWTVVKLELQRTADLAALAGATEYKLASNASNATNAAASFAELNGAVGGTTRTWDSGAKLLSDNQITAQVVAGVRDDQNTALKVTVTQTVPLALTRIMSSLPHVSIGATGWAELDIGWQPCIVALSTGGDGVTAQGNPAIDLTGCSIRSNALDNRKNKSIDRGGSATISASAFYANGSIDSQVRGPRYENIGTIPDPYSAHPAV